MADEITFSINMSVTKGSFKFAINPGQQTVTMSGTGGGNPGKVTITTSAAAISLGSVTTPGLCYVKNLDDTNFVTLGPQSDAATIEPFLKLKAGEDSIFRLDPAITVWGQADTASCDVQIYALDD